MPRARANARRGTAVLADGRPLRNYARMRFIPKLRFDAFAGYARLPIAQILGRELEYFESDGGTIFGMLIQDIPDEDYFAMIFAPDARLRYRSAGMTGFVDDPEAAKADLTIAMVEAEQAEPETHHQGDETGAPIDFFTPVRPAAVLNPDFSTLISQETFSPAMGIIEPMMRWYEDVDGNFIEQFQTTGFDQRIWELYLFATLIENGIELDRSDSIPDFVCSGLRGGFTMEAVTVGPTRQGGTIVPPPTRATPEDQLLFLEDYMPIKFGSALFSKLGKRYWERPNVAGGPFVLAIADFSERGSMIHTRSALERYLYGMGVDDGTDAEGALEWRYRPIESHSFGGKTIPSGFFRLPDAVNVSAVISSTAGTIAKFNRMGLKAGFGSGRVLMIREGTVVDHDPDARFPKMFKVIVNAPGYEESWTEGVSVYHNPNALHPLDPGLFPDAAHHFQEPDGRLRSFTPDFYPLGSVTRHLAPVDVAEVLAAAKATHAMWTFRQKE